MWPNPQFPADLVTFTEEIFNGKLHFSCSVLSSNQKLKVALAFQKHQSNGHQKTVEEDTSKDNL